MLCLFKVHVQVISDANLLECLDQKSVSRLVFFQSVFASVTSWSSLLNEDIKSTTAKNIFQIFFEFGYSIIVVVLGPMNFVVVHKKHLAFGFEFVVLCFF